MRHPCTRTVLTMTMNEKENDGHCFLCVLVLLWGGKGDGESSAVLSSRKRKRGAWKQHVLCIGKKRDVAPA